MHRTTSSVGPRALPPTALGLLILTLAACGGDSPSDPSETPSPPPPNVRVSRPENPRPEEVAIAIDPTNPARMVIGSNLDFYYYSWDGGLSWTERRLLAPSFGVWGDPSIAYDPEGRVYYAHLSNPPEAEGFFIDRIVVQRSTDGGANFDDGQGVAFRPPKNQDKSWIIPDLTDSPYRGQLYLAWTEFDRYGSDDPADRSRILFSHTADAGATWSEPVVVSDVEGDARDDDDTVEGAVPAVGPEGQVYVSWSGPLGIMLDKSLDGGNTFGRDLYVTSQPGGWAFGGLRPAARERHAGDPVRHQRLALPGPRPHRVVRPAQRSRSTPTSSPPTPTTGARPGRTPSG